MFYSDEKIRTKVKNYVKILLLPLLLIVLFVIQNIVFDVWIHIFDQDYTLRLILVTSALGVVLYGPALLFKKRNAYIYLFLMATFVSFVFIAQFLYFTYSDSFLQFSAVKYIGQTSGVLGTIKILLKPELIVFLLNFLVVLGAYILQYKKSAQEFILPRWEKVILVAVMAGFVVFGYQYLLYTEKKEWGSTSRLYSDVYDLNALVGKMGIVNFTLEDTLKSLLRSNLVSADDKNFLVSWSKSKTVAATDGKDFGLEKGKNLIIIQVESLENAVINQSIDGQEITPNLNKLAQQGMYFDNYYTQVGPGNTADAEFSTLNSLYPLPDDVVFIDYAKNTYHALPQLLDKNGYQTYVMHGDVPTFWNRSNVYPGLGYQKVFDLSDYTVTRPVGEGPSDLGDEDLFSQSLPRLASFKTPFMATLITMSSHTPFILPDDLQTLSIPTDSSLNDTQRNYLESVHYADKAIGEFIDGLKADGLYDNSLIMIWGDHGSFTNIASALGRDQGTLPGLVNSQVPLIMLGSGLSGTMHEPGSHLDIYPTIADLLGISPPATILGQDLLNTQTPVALKFSLVSGGITSILTNNLGYQSGSDGDFDDGQCFALPAKTVLPIGSCQNIYTQESDQLKASDIIVRGDLMSLFASSIPNSSKIQTASSK